MGEWFALLSSLAFAVSHILIRRGLAQSNPIAGFCLSISISALALWFLAAMYLPLSSFWTHIILYFALSGIFASGLGRMFIYVGIDRIGVSRSVPVAGSAPMFASILAVLVIGETWSLQNFTGTLLIIGQVQGPPLQRNPESMSSASTSLTAFSICHITRRQRINHLLK